MIRVPVRLLALACLLALALPAHGQETSPLPEQKPVPSETTTGETTETAETPEVKPNLPGDKATVAWTDAEVAAAKAACAKQLAGITLAYEPLPPIKEGICGAPAPILVTSIGDVAISPPATMRCGLAVKLDGWLKTRVQPKAKATLGGAVVKIRNATSYSCRNRYGGANTRISEHALANALDISEFVLASGERVTVLKSWPRVVPPPEPEPEQIATSDTTGAIVPVSNRRTVPKPASQIARPTVAKSKPSRNPFVAQDEVDVTLPIDPRTNPFVSPVSVTAAAPPMAPPVATPPQVKPPKVKPPEVTPPAAEPADAVDPVAERRTAFVRGVHADACKIFGTVLGPEANDAHRDHFHLDMKARRHSSFCE
ncbi:MAG TPA: extensin family protein [Methyloceanibacter sp.]|nr:extensin family protein [Methyloceanibacter sp.]